jgi:spermidine synthase/MFS family permease
VIVLLLFFLSGVASLVLETVFRRELTLYVGNAVTATSLTLATFLGGLALGAALFGRIADRSSRPLRLYAILELGVGASGALAVALLSYGRTALLGPVRAAGPGAAGSLVAAAIAAALLLPPTILMGGTLPALTNHRLRGGGRFLGSLATLYGVNTLGASLGAALAGFVLFESLGVSSSGWVGAGLAALVGAVALAIDAREDAPERASTPRRRAAAEARAPSIAARRVALAVATISGAAALGYEVVWTRLLVLPLRSYSYSFSLMLSLFLLGLVLGALVLARFERKFDDALTALAVVQLAAASYVATSVVWLPRLLALPPEGSGLAAFLGNAFLRAGPVVIPPTILSGMSLPLAVRVFSADADRPGNAVGIVYAVNTLGSIAGALAAGLWLLPALGTSRSLALLATCGAISGTAAAAVAWGRDAKVWTSMAIAAACALAVLRPTAPFTQAFSRPERSRDTLGPTVFYKEGATDTVAVVSRGYGFRDPDAKSVLVNGISMTATVKRVWRYMAAEGHLPALFAPRPTRGLVICVGTGITLGALASHDSITAIDAVDLSESVLAALPVFDRENRSAIHDPKVNIVHADGRHFLELSDRRYGVITVEPPPPIVAGSVHLYTLDFYRLCRAHLEPGGVVAQWLPLHSQSLASAQATARTFLEAFPYAQLWQPSIRDAVLIGSDRPLRLGRDRLRAVYAVPLTKESLTSAYLETPEALLGTYLLDRDGIARWAGNADVITDDRPWIEFFRRYGANMRDPEIGTLLMQEPGALDDVLGANADHAFRSAVEFERETNLRYLRAETVKDPEASRQAALASRATRFGLYRLGCDGPQLDALRADPGHEAEWTSRVEMCRGLIEGRPPSDAQ